MLDNTYQPSSFEKDIYDFWLKSGLFKAKVDKNKPPFCIILPPPNITDRLHVGHAFNATLQDILIRYKRMQGYSTLFQPGTDHAAIATEAKIVSHLLKQGIKKDDLTREEFLRVADEWYDKYNGIIVNQFKALGLACDWDRLAFTMDEHCSLAVRTAFVKLYNEGLIYKGDRMTSWCPNCNTALSDIEVNHTDSESKLWYIKYPVSGTKDYIAIATTRPETMLGDTAVAVSPKDARYKHLIGKELLLPLTNRKIPVIADNMVDISFGTGAVKITPAHDQNDYECSIRNKLPVITVIDKNGKMSENTGKYSGLDRFVAREAVVADLKEKGYLIKIEKYKNSVGHCERCDTIIEPVFTKQWFVKMEQLARPAIDCVKSGELTFYPARMKKIYLHWMENIHDWCISRQIWSGHRIPVFTCSNGHEFASIEDPKVCPICGNKSLSQETDVLDTWFSSALWPMSTLGFPDKSEFLDYFYPTSVLVTAYEIIFLWVARMIFSGLKYTGKIPFSKAFLHGIIRDDTGRKMSKNLGNGIDPVDVIEKYGIDALRFSLVYNITLGTDSRYSFAKAQHASIFLNKLYNAGKYVIANAKSDIKENKDSKNNKENKFDAKSLNIYEKWILTELNKTISSCNKKIEKLDIGAYTSIMYDFVWNKFCDKFIELNKVSVANGGDSKVLVYVYTAILQLLHPVVPFITEKIYNELLSVNNADVQKINTIETKNYKKAQSNKNISGLQNDMFSTSILQTNFPTEIKIKKDTFQSDVNNIFELIKDIRSVRAENKIGENIKVKCSVVSNEKIYLSQKDYIKKLCLLSDLEFTKPKDISEYIVYKTATYTIYIKNINIKNKKDLLIKYNEQLNLYQNELDRSNKLLANAGFVLKAPQQLIDAEKEKIAKYTKLIAELKHLIKEV